MSFPGTFQSDHREVALPAEQVTPRLTTAEAIAETLRLAERGTPPRFLVGWDVLESGSAPTRDYEVRFVYADGTSQTWAGHRHGGGLVR